MFSAAIIIYSIVAGISAACSVFVCISLWRFGSLKTPATQLMLLVHLTLLLEESSSLPYIYNLNANVCLAVSFLHFYSGLSNSLALGLLILSYRYHFIEDSQGWAKFMFNRSKMIIFGLPLITLLPFATHSYDGEGMVWCTMQTDSRLNKMWAFGVFYLWIWLLLAMCLVTTLCTFYQVYSVDKYCDCSLFSTTGLYTLVSIVAWVPRTVARFTSLDHSSLGPLGFLFAYLPIYVAGILYTVVFLREKHSLLLFERMARFSGWHAASPCADVSITLSFSWEGCSQSLIDLDDIECLSDDGTVGINEKRVFYSPLLCAFVGDGRAYPVSNREISNCRCPVHDALSSSMFDA